MCKNSKKLLLLASLCEYFVVVFFFYNSNLTLSLKRLGCRLLVGQNFKIPIGLEIKWVISRIMKIIASCKSSLHFLALKYCRNLCLVKDDTAEKQKL